MKIAVIGAGIYGCHLALKLRKLKYDVDIYDMGNDIFSGASTNNSFKIHKGYHYTRSAKTREMCILDEIKFCKEYSHLINSAVNNPKIYCVADDNRTILDYKTMKIIIDGTGLHYNELTINELHSMGFRNIEGGFRVNEAVLLVDVAKRWFKQALQEDGVNLYLNYFIDQIGLNNLHNIKINNQPYDYVINCTYNQALHLTSKYNSHFELCFYLIAASKLPKELCKTESFGIFDGPFPSIEPYGYKNLHAKFKQFDNKKLFQVFHVTNTIVDKFANICDIRAIQAQGLNKEQTDTLTEKIITDLVRFYPNFNNEFSVIGNNTAIRTKINYSNDTRPLIVEIDDRHPKLIQVFSSKLTSVFSAEEKLIKLIG